jgi:hypothetical protein
VVNRAPIVDAYFLHLLGVYFRDEGSTLHWSLLATQLPHQALSPMAERYEWVKNTVGVRASHLSIHVDIRTHAP